MGTVGNWCNKISSTFDFSLLNTRVNIWINRYLLSPYARGAPTNHSYVNHCSPIFSKNLALNDNTSCILISKTTTNSQHDERLQHSSRTCSYVMIVVHYYMQTFPFHFKDKAILLDIKGSLFHLHILFECQKREDRFHAS